MLSEEAAERSAIRFDISPEDIIHTAEYAITRERQFLDTIAQVEKPAFDSVIVPLKEADNKCNTEYRICGFLQYVSSDKDVRDASAKAMALAYDCKAKYLERDDVYKAVRAVYDNDKEMSGLEVDDRILVEKMELKFRRSGLLLSENKRNHLAKLEARLNELTYLFNCNIDNMEQQVLFTRKELEESLRGKLTILAKKELYEIEALKRSDMKTVKLPYKGVFEWDIEYYMHKVATAKSGIKENFCEYFAIDTVLPRMLSFFQELFGISITHVNNLNVWNPDVIALEVWESDKQTFVGNLYLDLYARDEALVSNKNVESGLNNLRQLFYGMYDLSIHNSTKDNVNIQKVYNDMAKDIALVNNGDVVTYGAATFSHVMADYESTYFEYLQAAIYGADLFLKHIHRDGTGSIEASAEFGPNILRLANDSDQMKNMTNFFGRNPNSEAFFKLLG
ncbi:metalloendopeptidase [Coemansia sp. RSA 988]|nr:metalloendopeptidase [Coemansia sp. RSA 988]